MLMTFHICSRQLFTKTLDTISGDMLCLQITALPQSGLKSTISPLNKTFISLTQSNISESICECLWMKVFWFYTLKHWTQALSLTLLHFNQSTPTFLLLSDRGYSQQWYKAARISISLSITTLAILYSLVLQRVLWSWHYWFKHTFVFKQSVKIIQMHWHKCWKTNVRHIDKQISIKIGFDVSKL